jgi:hypothetical protein
MKEQDNSLWIAVDHIVDMVKIDRTTLKYITNDYDYCYGFFGNSQRMSYNKIEHLKVVVRYFVKSFVGIMCRFGLCDLATTQYQAYSKQDVRILQTEELRSFANVEFYKLSDLGLCVLGLESEFKSENDYKLILNPYVLEVKVENRNNLSDIMLENIATKIDDTKYKIDIKSFMKNINSKSEYKRIKTSFLSKTTQLPKNFKKFFEMLESREDTASVITSTAILIKIKNDKEVLKLISTNQKLQEKILKADRLHLVVMRDDLAYVKRVFKEYGVLI